MASWREQEFERVVDVEDLVVETVLVVAYEEVNDDVVV